MGRIHGWLLCACVMICITTITGGTRKWLSDLYQGLPGTNEVTRDFRIRVMTFNIWNSGINVLDGFKKIVKHILYVNPDVVALQEVESLHVCLLIARELGPDWSPVCRNQLYTDVAILTRHWILDSSAISKCSNDSYDGEAAVWAKIFVQKPSGTMTLNFWAVHFDWRNYGPYAACNKLVYSSKQIDAGEYNLGIDVPGRAQNALKIINSKEFRNHLQRTDVEPLFVAGDFNSPSHLDWTPQMESYHCGWTYRWPATLAFSQQGLSDAFRTVYPDPASVPGNTWSTVQKAESGWGGMISEPQDRIDLILFRASHWTPRRVTVYNGEQPVLPTPNHTHNDWPSDHSAAYAEFVPFSQVG